MERDLPTTGVLTSPNFQERYPHDLNQVQKIQVPEGNTIRIRFTDFDVEREYDTVTITDKDGTRLGLFDIGVYSYADWRREIVSITDAVEVLFHTDVSGSDMGWRLEWGKYKVSISILLLFIVFNRSSWKEWSFDVSQLPAGLSQPPFLYPAH